jgi:DNA repair exonuclease SbcCD ATPase subunit
MPYHTQQQILAGDQFEKIQMAVDNLKQSMEDEYWVNMNENAEDWLTDNAEDHGYVEMGCSVAAEDWLTENAETHGYVDEDLLADSQSEQERLKDEIEKLKKKNEELDAEVEQARSGLKDYEDEIKGMLESEIECLKKRAETQESLNDAKAEIKRLKDKHNTLLESLAPA